ncbi:MAG: AAA family ATPase, partial [Nannocystaceae bacterium]|nr:AAA family ATPase [Nannocystaceae bacterium]
MLGADEGPEATWGGETSPNFVGREHERAALHRAVQLSRERSVVAVVLGPSGCGKSALARAVRGDIVREGGVVLAGRCFQQERLPLRALDSIVDALAGQLGDERHRSPELRRAIQAHAGALGRVFPVLRVVRSIADALETAPLEPIEVRRQAFEGLHGILLALARTQPVVICIDDLQWGDAESATQLGDLLTREASPGILLLGTARSDEREDSDFFRVWDRLLPRLAGAGRLLEQELPPLTESDCGSIATALLGSGATELDTAVLVREANGSPFFLEELIRQAQRLQASTQGQVGNIREAVSARIKTLSVEERRVFELVSVAGPPIGAAPLLRASGLGPPAWTALDTLRAAHLVRTRERTGALHVEAYHDRTRVASLELIAPDAMKAMHRDLAGALEADETPDDARVARHWVDGGEFARAVDPADRAATAAYEALAFERAAELWEIVVDGLPEQTTRRRDVRRSRADALVYAGRAAEAAPELEALAEEGTDGSDLRRAAEQWLTSGHVTHGTKVLSEALGRVGLSSPARATTAMAKAMFWLPGVMLRRARMKSELDPAKMEQVDVCWSAVRGLSSVDYVRGLYFVVLGMRLALSLGEPTRCARFGMFLAAQLRAMGAPGSTRLFNRYRDQALDQASPELSAYAQYLDGYVHIQQGRPRDAAVALRPALQRFENECRGVGWEITIGSNMLGEAIFQGGDINELRTFSETIRRRAESLNDINGIQGSLTFLGLAALADDRVDDARRAYDELLSVWTVDGFHYPHFMSGLCRSICDLYEGLAIDGLARLDAMAPELRESGLGRAPYVRANFLARQAG